MYCCAVLHTIKKLHKHEFPWFGKKGDSASDKLQAALYNYTVKCNSHIMRNN